MPCWTYQTAETDPGKMLASPLIDALTALGMMPTHSRMGIIDFDGGHFDIKAGTLHFKGILATRSEKTTELIMTHYADAVVKQTAAKMGWKLKEISKFKYKVIKH